MRASVVTFMRALAALTVAALLALPGTSLAQDAPGPHAFSPDRVIVEWAAGASPAERRAARDAAEVEFARDLGNRRFQLVATEPGQSPAAAVEALEADPAVALAERDAYAAELALPNDPLFDQLWGLQNSGLGIDFFSGAVAGADIGASSAWDRTIGSPSTVVAVLDGGYRFEHPDLADVVWSNPLEAAGTLGVDDDGNGIADDLHGADFVGPNLDAIAVDGDPTDDDLLASPGGHGVHTAGTIGAEGNNGIGITGVAQDVSLMPLRVCSYRPSNGSRSCPYSALIQAVNYAGAEGARVANLSVGGEAGSTALANALAANPQTLFVISAGNDGASNETTPTYPCVYSPLAEGKSTVDNVICVAATDQADQRADFSNWGVNTVDLGAPGTETLSAALYRYFIEDDFELDDFGSKWTASGADGGLLRSNEAPLSSFGLTDSPGATPVPGAERASTSAAVTVPPGYEACNLEFTRAGNGFFEVLLDGENEFGFSLAGAPGRVTRKLLDELGGGGEVAVRVSYKAGPTPGPNSGVWIDNLALHCIAKPGEADGYRFAQGTSMAAPHVTGAAALLFSLKPSASVTEVRQALLGSVDPVSSLAGKTTSGGRLDAAAALDLFDAVPPPTPTLSTTSPASPSKSNQPRLLGSAQRGTSVAVYASATCSGPPVAGGTAAQLAKPGIAVTVAGETTTELSVRATDLAPHTSACSAPISYTENSDSVAPAPPQLLGTDPASPGASGTPRILGSAEPGSTVRVYAGAACAGAPVALGSAAVLGSQGIEVGVAEGVTAVLSATATDGDGNASACSTPISYTRVKAADPGGGGGEQGDPPSPARCVVPKLAGKTLARAKAALRAAACSLGKVRRPRPRDGRPLPPLVVRSTTPAAGAAPAGGKVDLTLGPKPRKARR